MRNTLLKITTASLLIITSFTVYAQGNAASAVGSSDSEHYAKLNKSGMAFTPNKGQIADKNGNLCPDVLYKADGGSSDIYLRKTGISYVQTNRVDVMHKIDEQLEELKAAGMLTEIDKQQKKEELLHKEKIKTHRVDIDFEGANANCRPINEDELDGYQNYYYAHCPQGITNVKQYNKVTYKNIYKDIDVTYFGNSEKGLKYDLIVQPHADPNQIKLHWKGAEKIKLESSKLKVESSLGEMIETLPKVYQNINGKIVDVECKYKLDVRYENIDMRNDSKKTHLTSHISHLKSKIYEVSFELGTYNIEFPLIIDPWATYYGGQDYSTGIATDDAGNIVISGVAGAANFPILGATQATFGGGNTDAIIVKFSYGGTRLWATYYGGTNEDSGTGVATDKVGNVFVSGTTKSANFPVLPAGGYSQAYVGATFSDAFVLKLSPAGARLWATYYGGDKDDSSTGIATDNTGNVAITGQTKSANFPVLSAGGYSQLFNSVAYHAFVVKFNNSGVRQWATLYGGSGVIATNVGYGEINPAITTDNAGNILLTGATFSLDFPTGSIGPNFVFQQTNVGAPGNSKAFVVKFGGNGIRQWATYYGGTRGENYLSITSDNSGNVIIAGQTSSFDLPLSTVNTATSIGIFIVKFSSFGFRLWATNFGGGQLGAYPKITTDVNNFIYLLTEEEDPHPSFPLVQIDPCGYQSLRGGNEDQIIVKFDPDGKKICSTYLGGSREDDLDMGGGIVIFGNSLFITGWSYGLYPVTSGAFQTIPLVDWASTIFVASICTNICEGKTLSIDYSANITNPCNNTLVTFTPNVTNSCDTSGYKYQWTFVGATATSSTYVKPGVSYTSPGTYPVKLVVTTPCKKDSITKTNYITVTNCSCNLSASATVTANNTCSGANDGSVNVSIVNGSGGPYTYSWSNGANGTTTTTTIPLTGLSANVYTVTITEGLCAAISVVAITQQNTLAINSIASTNATLCNTSDGSATVNISGSIGGPYTYSWSNGTSSVTNSTTNTTSGLLAGTYTVTVSKGFCKALSTINISVAQPVVISASSIYSCITNKGTATAFPTNGTQPFLYLWGNGQSSASATGLILGSSYTVTVTDANNCTTTTSVLITTTSTVIDTSSLNNSCSSTSKAAVLVSTPYLPITYTWSSGQTEPVVDGLTAGGYTVTVTDGNGCTQTRNFNITGVNPATGAFTSPPFACVNQQVCFTDADNSGGDSWTITSVASGTALVSGTTANFCYTFLTKGTYRVVHNVSVGSCSGPVAKQIIVSDCTGPIVTATGISLCSGSCASVTSSPTGGTSPYTYSWSTGESTQNISPCPVSTTTYTVKVTDAGGGTTTSTAVVTVNPAVTATSTTGIINCSGSTGFITATGSNGTSPYTFNWNTGATTTGASSTIPNLPANTYSVIVTDANGCTSTTAATLIAPPPLLGQFTKGTATCTNCGCKEWVLVNAIDGTPPYTFLWPDGYDKRYKNKICKGNYAVKVTDKNGCSVDVNITAP